MRVEHGHDLGLSTAVQITKVLGLSLDALVAEPKCGHCLDMPPAGFICERCGEKDSHPYASHGEDEGSSTEQGNSPHE
jgi:hypothetical protein